MLKRKWIYLVIVSALIVTGCKKRPRVFGDITLDHTLYPVQECQRELYCHAEVKGPQIDKLIVYKKRRRLYALSKGKLVLKCRISLGKNADKGHKIQAGDYKTPIGHYHIVRKKCDRRLYRSLMISYPDREDRERARRLGVNPGGYITIHGQPKWNARGIGNHYTFAHDWTEGCIAVPNSTMRKLWRAVQRGVRIDIHP